MVSSNITKSVEDKVSNVFLLSWLIPIMITGFIGNIFVLIIYTFRMKSSNHRTFIMTLGGLDMCICSIAMPLTVVKVWRPSLDLTEGFCKTFWIANFFMTISSVLTLLLIAVDRYRKLCVPFGRQISRHLAVKLCGAVVCSALIVSCGVLVVNDCDIGVKDRSWQYDPSRVTFHLGLLIGGLLFAIVIATLYTLIWHNIQKHAKCLESNSRSTPAMKSNEEINIDVRTQQSNILSQDDRRKLKNRKRTAMMFFLITVIFIISYIPYCILEVCADLGALSHLSNDEIRYLPELNLIRFFVYINHITNCFVYSCYDVRFREEIKAVLRFRKMA